MLEYLVQSLLSVWVKKSVITLVECADFSFISLCDYTLSYIFAFVNRFQYIFFNLFYIVFDSDNIRYLAVK